MVKRKYEIPKLTLIIAAVSFFVLGVVVSVFLVKLPFEIDTTLSFGDIVSVASVICTILVVPIIVEKCVSNSKSRRSLFIEDLEKCLMKLESVWSDYWDIYSGNSKIKVMNRRTLLSSMRALQNQIDRIASSAEYVNKVDSANELSSLFGKMRAAMTDNFTSGHMIRESDCLEAQKQYNILLAKISKMKYDCYD